MGISITQVDVFTDRPFAGNPAAVCLLAQPREESWMQFVAREMNLSETAFLLRRDDGFDLRWFTPTVEVDLCGHATLASAHFLWEEGHLAPDQTARFHTRSGLLTAEKKEAWIEMDFPATPAEPHAPVETLESGLGVKFALPGRTRFDSGRGGKRRACGRALKPDFGELGQLEVRGVMVTSRSARPNYDFVSRFFAPAFGN